MVLTNILKEDLSSREGSPEVTTLAARLAALVTVCFGTIYRAKGIEEVKGPLRYESSSTSL